MSVKTEIVEKIEKEYERWEEFLAGFSEAELLVLRPDSSLSIKDVMAHLMAWQQVSLARLQAGQSGGEPVMPDWLQDDDPETETRIDEVNARIFAKYQDDSWPEVYQRWKSNYLRFIQYAKDLPEEVLVDTEKFAWLNGYALKDVFLGSFEHHDEHMEYLTGQGIDG